jgi:serine/threonine protein kinase
MSNDRPPVAPGDVLAGKYRVERLIAQGGMGAVFAAQHTILNQRVALKLLLGELRESQEAAARFLNEARAAAQIRGEHVARVLDVGQLPDGTPFMVLEYLEGSDLASLLAQRGALAVTEVADYALQALDALAQAHAAGIVHRDLKPANLFLARRHDGTSVIKVLDFGISKNLAPLGETPRGLTQTRALMGSPEYMSPEQLRTPRAVDTRTDIWSLGVILYELLTGKTPFEGPSVSELFVQILEATPLAVHELRADVPAELEAAIARCMSRDPGARFATVQDLAAALLPFASEPLRATIAARESLAGGSVVSSRAGDEAGKAVAVPAPRVTSSPPWANTQLPARRRPPMAALVIAGAAGLVLVLVVLTTQLGRANRPGPAAGLVAGATGVTTADPGLATGPPPAPPPTDPPSEAPAIAPAATTNEAEPAATKPAPRPTPERRIAPPPRTTSTVTPPPTAAQKDCTTKFVYDQDGHKRFKPECY